MNCRFWSAADRGIERGDIGATRGRAEPFEHACLVVLRLQPADEPGARVRHRLVVEVDRILRREHEPEPERAALLEDREDRLLRRRRGRRRHVAGDLVHVGQRPQVGRSRLAPHPGDELREDERRDEHPLLVGQVREIDDRRARLAVGREQERLRVERRTLAPGGEGRRRDQRVQLQRERGAILRRGRRHRSRTRRACGAGETGSRRSATRGRGRGPARQAFSIRFESRTCSRLESGSAVIPTRPSRLVTVPSISSRSASASVSHESDGARREPITFSGTPAEEPGV